MHEGWTCYTLLPHLNAVVFCLTCIKGATTSCAGTESWHRVKIVRCRILHNEGNASGFCESTRLANVCILCVHYRTDKGLCMPSPGLCAIWKSQCNHKGEAQLEKVEAGEFIKRGNVFQPSSAMTRLHWGSSTCGGRLSAEAPRPTQSPGRLH